MHDGQLSVAAEGSNGARSHARTSHGFVEHLGRIADLLPGAIYALRRSPEGVFDFPYASAQLEALFGFGDGELTSDPSRIFAGVHADDLAALTASIDASAASLTVWSEQFRIHHPVLGVRWILGKSTPERDAAGNITWFGFAADVTDSRQVSEALRERERMLAAVIGHSPSVLTIKDLQGRFVLANPNMQRLVGRTEPEIVGTTVFDYLDAAVAQRITDNDARVIATNDRVVFEERLVFGGREYVYSSFKFPIPDAHGNPAHVCSISLDVTEARRAEAALRETETRFRQLAESVREVFWLTDVAKQQILYVSPGYEGIWGRSVESLIADPAQWVDAVHPEDRARVLTGALERQMLGTYDEEYRIVRPDGTVRWIHDQGYPVHDESGAVTRVAGIAEDITERLTLEASLRQTQKMESIGQLAGGVAHDFNNALTVIMGCARLLEMQKGMPAESEGLLSEIRGAAERAGSLTRQLLAFSRQEVIAPRVLDLNAAIEETRRMLDRLLGEDVPIQVALDRSIPHVKVDPGHVVQILMNLAVNARDAMPQGGTLSIATSLVTHDARYARHHPGAPDGAFVELLVSDVGTGMTPEVQARIFEPFFTTKSAGRGTGLGLSVVHGIVTQNGGTIDVESTPGRGTTFRIAFPAVYEDASPGERPDRAHVARGGERILLVEDDESVRRIAERALRRANYDVLVATDGVEALQIMADDTLGVSAIITDVVMPRMSGSDLAEGLRAMLPGARILFTSGYTNDALIRNGFVESGVTFLPKPYKVDELLAATRRLLDRP